MHYRKRLLAVFLAVFLSMKAEPSMSQPEVKSYIPPSPNAMTFMKYGDYPVDFSTGVPGISIPLYNIDLKGFSFPISASFHASGRTTSLNFSSLGLNWALNASGMISREVKGKVDVESYSNHPEQPASYYSPQVSHRDELVAMENPTRQGSTSSTDTEYDIYSISINGLSAKFIIRNNGSVVFLTYCPYSVTGGPGSGFTVTDDKGSVYKFGNEAGGYGMTEMASNIGNTSWCISSITTFSGCIIRFKYGSLTPTDQAQKGIGSWSYTDQATIGLTAIITLIYLPSLAR